MKIGYPCINSSIPRTSPSTFKLASYSEDRLIQSIKGNIVHSGQILRYNAKNNLLFFRISSDLIPFSSHPVKGASLGYLSSFLFTSPEAISIS